MWYREPTIEEQRALRKKRFPGLEIQLENAIKILNLYRSIGTPKEDVDFFKRKLASNLGISEEALETAYREHFGYFIGFAPPTVNNFGRTLPEA